MPKPTPYITLAINGKGLDCVPWQPGVLGVIHGPSLSVELRQATTISWDPYVPLGIKGYWKNLVVRYPRVIGVIHSPCLPVKLGQTTTEASPVSTRSNP